MSVPSPTRYPPGRQCPHRLWPVVPVPPRASAASRRPAERLPRGQPSAGGPRPPGPSAACLGRSHLSGAWCHLSPSSAAFYFPVSPAPTGKRVGLSPRGVTPHRTLSRCPCSEGSAGKVWVVPEGLPLSSARPAHPVLCGKKSHKAVGSPVDTSSSTRATTGHCRAWGPSSIQHHSQNTTSPTVCPEGFKTFPTPPQNLPRTSVLPRGQGSPSAGSSPGPGAVPQLW